MSEVGNSWSSYLSAFNNAYMTSGKKKHEVIEEEYARTIIEPSEEEKRIAYEANVNMQLKEDGAISPFVSSDNNSEDATIVKLNKNTNDKTIAAEPEFTLNDAEKEAIVHETITKVKSVKIKQAKKPKEPKVVKEPKVDGAKPKRKSKTNK